MSNPALTTLTGGGFTDAASNVLANGYLLFYLSHDEQETQGPSQVVAGLPVQINLDNNGNVVVGSQIYANDQMSPSGSYYTVFAYTNDGRKAWAYPQYITVTSSSPPFNLSGIFPTNPPGSGGSGSSGPLFETNGTSNANQAFLNLESGTGITVTNTSSGNVLISGGGYPAGANILTMGPYGNTASAGLNGYTIVMRIPAAFLVATGTAGVQVGIVTNSVTGLVVNTASIGATVAGPIIGELPATWSTSPVPLTWPAGAFASAYTTYFSNTCAITVDTAHDYYITVYFDSTSPSGSAYVDNNGSLGWPTALVDCGCVGYISGNHAADANPTALQSSLTVGAAPYCFSQVVLA